MDHETADAILSAQVADLTELIDKRKGKGVEGSLPKDEGLAIDLQLEEMKRVQTFLGDCRMAASIGHAVINDGPAVVLLAAEERSAAADRNMACAMAGKTCRRDLSAPDCRTEESILARFEAFSIGMDDDAASCFNESLVSCSEPDPAESSRHAAKRSYRGPPTFHECSSCLERRKTIRAPCGHHYCQDCITSLYAAALDDETLHPVRCCREVIPISVARKFLSSELALKTELKTIELATPNRTYCSNQVCSRFISPDYIEGHIATCSVCTQRSCTLCKLPQHSGRCPDDPAREQVLQLARREGWQSCSRCHAIVELRTGCNHMT